MPIFHFIYFQTLQGFEINTTARTSVWADEEKEYLMPCQFLEIKKEDNFYNIKIEMIEPEYYMHDKYLEKKFLFGYPGRIIGYGILKEINRSG